MAHTKSTFLPYITSHKKLHLVVFTNCSSGPCALPAKLGICRVHKTGWKTWSRIEEITFHHEDSFIIGYLGFEIRSSHSSKDRWQSCRKQDEKKFERSSNLPHLQRTICGTFVWPVLKSLRRRSAWDLVFRAIIPGTWKHVQSCSAPTCVFHVLRSRIWWFGKLGCYIAQHWAVWSSFSKEFPFRTNPFTHTSLQKVFFFLAHKRFAAEPGAYYIVWEDFAPFYASS